MAEERVAKAEMRLTDIADQLQSDWVPLARQLGFTQQEIVDIQKEYTYVGEQVGGNYDDGDDDDDDGD